MQIGQTAVFSADDRMIGGAPPWEFYKLYRNPAKQFLNIIAISDENVKLVKIGAIFLTVMKRSQAVQLRNYIKKVQPQAFMMITNSSEIIGKGFCNTI